MGEVKVERGWGWGVGLCVGQGWRNRISVALNEILLDLRTDGFKQIAYVTEDLNK